MAELSWTDAQWQKVNDAVTEAFGKASATNQFLMRCGPLAGSAEIVRNELLVQDDPQEPRTVRLDGDHDDVNRRFVNLTVNVLLSSEQVADETLLNALLTFRRAGNILAQEEDRIVFAGFRRGLGPDDSQFVANNVEPQLGLADLPARRNFPSLDTAGGLSLGQAAVVAVVDAISRLENNFNPGPFACVLGNRLFDEVHTPTANLVLPADRIIPMLRGGPLLRSGQMDGNVGIGNAGIGNAGIVVPYDDKTVVVPKTGNTIDIVVATPPTVQFLQRRADSRFVFRVYERFVLRIRDAARPPVAGFRIAPTPAQRANERIMLDLIARQR